LQEIRRRCEGVQDEIDRLIREQRTGFDHDEKIEQLSEELEHSNEEKIRLETRWQEERSLVDDIHKVENSIAGAVDDSIEPLQGELEALRLKLASIQEVEALVPVAVDGRVVAEVVSGWTGIPVGRILVDGVASARTLKERMAMRIVGQDAALDTICSRIQTFYAELGEPSKPTGVFLLVGPSGVGKTETAITLAELLFGGVRSLITVNMSEYQEAHSVSTIRGAPPGYVGYGRGGVLTEAVRRNPFSVVLLDEVEKAHPDVLEVFYQVFDRGIIEDSEGQLVDFTNTLILLTSNAGSDVLMGLPSNRAAIDAEVLVEAVRPSLLQQFPAAFLGRLVVVPYRLLGERELSDIARLKLTRIQERFAATQRAELTYDDALIRAVVARARQTESGARVIDAILTDSVLPGLSGRILDHMTDGGCIGGVHIGFDSRGKIFYEIRP
jgi:type VI secretion system protein VasG